jgi:hypothetical protein
MILEGRRAEPTKRVLLICQRDQYANGVKAAAIEQFLRERGHDVCLADTYYLSRASSSKGSIARKLPSPDPRKAALYVTEAAAMLLTRREGFCRRHLSYHLLVAECRLRSAILASSLPLDAFDLVICEMPYDAGVLTHPTTASTLYDCPTPWADELLYEERLTARQHRMLRDWETSVFESVDHLAFHWESYREYALRWYGISGRNLMTLNWGTTPASAAARAGFENPPRIAYLGSLSSRFINLDLLSRLSHVYPHIDVYGGPPPDARLGLNYRGYVSPEVLREYQLGLVTCTDDELRRQGFSAKHLQYLSYGLPVLVPAWRQHLDLLRGSVPYIEQTFLSLIETMSDKKVWQAASDEAYDQALRLEWKKTLKPLEDLLARLRTPAWTSGVLT